MDITFLLSGLHIEKYSLQIYTVDNKRFTLYSFILQKHYFNKLFSWKINKSFNEFQKLNRAISSLPKPSTFSFPFPNSSSFSKETPEVQSEILFKYLSLLFSSPIIHTVLTEFLEISIESFTSSEKYKEGYVYKYGSAIINNQKRCFNSFSKVCGPTRRWLRILPDGVELRSSSTSDHPEDIIPYSNNFKIHFGRKGTGFSDRICLSTDRHNFLFRTENLQKRDEWIESLNTMYNKCEYKLFQVRYNSSFMIRDNNSVEFFIDGENYFAEVFNKLSQAQYAVCISDWWMSPELYLKRPVSLYPDSQVVEVLGSLADRGVKVYVLLYKEVTFALTLNSLYTKRALRARNKDIKVLRHPSVGLRGGEFFWSHHAKLICIDSSIAFMGGLDLCYGRWDTQDHPLCDFEGDLFPGIDYSNVRVSDFAKVHKWKVDSLERTKVPRMPWHDVCISVTGVVVKDLWKHFMELWNHVIKDITGSKKDRKDIIPLPDNTVVQRIQNGLHSVFTKNLEDPPDLVISRSKDKKPSYVFPGLVTGVKVEPREREEQLARMREKFLSNRENNDTISSDENPERLGSNKFNFLSLMRNFMTTRFLDPYPGAQRLHEETVEAEQDRDQDLDHEGLRREEEEEQDEAETSQALQAHERENDFITLPKRASLAFVNTGSNHAECQVLRSAGSWSLGKDKCEESILSAYYELILDAKYFIYIENQFFISNSAGKPVINTISDALIQRISLAIKLGEQFRVIVVIPLLPAFEGSVDDPSAAVLRVQLHWEYRTICRGKKSIYSKLRRLTDTPEEYICFYSLRTHCMLSGVPTTEMIYIHSKLMIVDDTTVIIGSANINDRSMNGDRDAELCLVIRDNERLTKRFGEREVKVTKFAHSFRMNLFKEHSGCDEDKVLENPFSREFYKVWDRRARRNTKIYREIFRCYPDNNIKKMSEVKEFEMGARKEMYEERAGKIKGNLVEFPLEFLSEENLKISVMSKESLLPDNTFV